MLTEKQQKIIKDVGYYVSIDKADDIVLVKTPPNIFNEITLGYNKGMILSFSYNEDGLVGFSDNHKWPAMNVSKPVAVAWIYSAAKRIADDRSTILQVNDRPEDTFSLSKEENRKAIQLRRLLDLSIEHENDADVDAAGMDLVWEFKILKGLVNETR